MDWLLDIYNYHTVVKYLPLFAKGMWTTVWISFVCLILSVALGALLAMAYLYGNRAWRLLIDGYTQFVRATPLLVQIFIIYHAIPMILVNHPQLIGDISSGIIALTLHTTPFMSEIIRAGIQSVGVGQTEAAMSVGMGFWQRMRHVILPQALANTIPPLLGQIAVLVKDTSLLSTIAVFEVMSAGTYLLSERIAPNEAFITVTACYLAIYILMLFVTSWARAKLGGAAWAAK